MKVKLAGERPIWLGGSYMKMLFLHVPKCGGSYTQRCFEPYASKCPSLTWREARGHLTFKEYDAVFKRRGASLRDYHIFTVVRNPWAWHVSWYNYLRNDIDGKKSGMPTEHYLFQNMDFRSYLSWLEDDDAPQSPQRYVKRNMIDWLTDCDDEIAVDIVLKNEKLRDQILALRDRFNLAISPPDKRINTSHESDYRTYYSDRDVDRIAVIHARDIDQFDYAFE